MRPNTLVHAGTHRLQHEAVPADQTVGGQPRTGVAALGEFGGLEVGVWEMTPGVMRDVESDEVFVVLCGSALIEFEDGTAPLTVQSGDVVRLAGGARTVWTVTETLRKVYLS
ncbi:MAG: cupin domain-containing protein [Mycobacterium sp.]|nr:cupin domain-containing protein [Mycobacterium sp.]